MKTPDYKKLLQSIRSAKKVLENDLRKYNKLQDSFRGVEVDLLRRIEAEKRKNKQPKK